MGKVIAGITMSLDGFINDHNGSAENLSPDFAELLASPVFKEMVANTGAVVMGRHVYEMADPFMWINDDYEFQVPLFIVTHTPPAPFPKGNDKLTLTFVTDGLESAISQAVHAAGDKDVQIIGGASIIQQCINAGLCNELWIDIMPILLGTGLRLFESIDTTAVCLEKIKTLETTPARTSIICKVTRYSPAA